EPLPYQHKKWIVALSISIVAIVCDRLMGLALVNVPDFILGSFVAVITLVAFVRYSVIVIPQTVLDRFVVGKRSSAN
ncbi:lipopolysaccharide biosynthesis protein, partial [Vibrio sp. 10N.222.55.E8]